MSDNDTMSPDVYDKKVLALDPEGAIAIKRAVHTIDVRARAADVMPAFAAALQDPTRRFGLIEVLRTADKLGQPFTLGERFHGRYVIEAGVLESLKKLGASKLASGFAKAVQFFDLDRVFDAVEDVVLSDYGMIAELTLDPAPGKPFRLRYEYLEGTPIAGSLSIECADTGPGTCRFTQITEYQEQGLEVVLVYGTAVLKMHNRVFYEEVKQSAALVGAAVIGTDIPEAYYRV